MAGDVAWMKKVCYYVAGYGHDMWHRVGIHACVYTCVCAHVRACEERDKASFSGQRYLSMIHLPYRHVDFHNFCHVGLCFVLKCVKVTWRHEERPIQVINEDHRSSLK